MLRANKRPTCKDCGEEFYPTGLTTRFCLTCATTRNRRKSENRKERNKRTVKRPKIKGWEKKRAKAAQEKYCGACGSELPTDRSTAIDHIVPAAIIADCKMSATRHGPNLRSGRSEKSSSCLYVLPREETPRRNQT